MEYIHINIKCVLAGIFKNIYFNIYDYFKKILNSMYIFIKNVNNINVPHLHFGMQLIFNEKQKDGINQIWIDVYNIIEFLKKNRSEVYMSNKETKDYSRK